MYGEMNKALYTDDAEGLKKYAPYIRALRDVFRKSQDNKLPGFRFFGGLDESGVGKCLTRRCQLDLAQAKIYQVGQKVCWSAFSSTSEATKGGNGGFTGLLFRVHCSLDPELSTEDSYYPASIQQWSKFPDENEVLIPPHYMLRVHNVNYNGEPSNPDYWQVAFPLPCHYMGVWMFRVQFLLFRGRKSLRFQTSEIFALALLADLADEVDCCRWHGVLSLQGRAGAG